MPSTACAEPAAQSSQRVDPGAALKRPAEQRAHASTPAVSP
jgi:hypothetical protein